MGSCKMITKMQNPQNLDALLLALPDQGQKV